MPNYCPSCGSEVKEGYKFCLNCGGQLQPEGTEGPSTPNEQAVQKPSINETSSVSPPQLPMTQQSYSPTIQPTKSNKKLIMVLIASVVIVVVIAVVVFVLLGSGADSRFVGNWQLEGGDGFTGSTMTFEGNGDWKMGYLGASFKIGKWNVQGDNFCLNMTNWFPEMDYVLGNTQCYQYEFSNDGNTLTLSATGEATMVLTKS